MTHTVLLIDDDPNVLNALSRVLRRESYDILTACSAEQAARHLQNGPVDLIVTDEEMPGMSGTEFLAKVRKEFPDTVAIVLTGHPSLPSALRAINEGKVYQFFTKPCNEIDLALTIRRALDQKELLAKSRDLLDVTRRQSALIEEARLARRLKGASRKERAASGARGDVPVDTRELLEEIDEQVDRGRALINAVRDGVAAATASDPADPRG